MMLVTKDWNTSSVPVPPIDTLAPGKTETATFALGWFWGPDAQFGSLPGVIRTRVGYAGGQKENPTYHSLGDHTESLQLDYDPSQISYQQLLEIFWASHNPTRKPWSRQYMSALFYHSDKQKELTLETKARLEAERAGKLFSGKIFTDILPAGRFYLAEDYHQKYLLKKTPELMQEFGAIYPNLIDFVNSTATTRVNGYVGGYGSVAALDSELESLGLSANGGERLRRIVQRFKR